MTLPVVWTPEADADLREALTWYENIHPDLGLRFAMAVDAAVEIVAQKSPTLSDCASGDTTCGSEALSLRSILQARNASYCSNCVHAWAAQSEALETPKLLNPLRSLPEQNSNL